MREASAAWSDAMEMGSRDLQARCLRLVLDAAIDLEAWDFVKDHVTELQRTTPGTDPMYRTTTARASALIAQVDGRPGSALDLLREHVDEGRQLVSRMFAARYLHHVGTTALRAWTADGDGHVALLAVEYFAEELSLLVSPGHAYYHGRALLELSKAAKLSGSPDRARGALAESIAIARAIGSVGLLTDCLELQARMLIESE
jgi:hypothetical protein